MPAELSWAEKLQVAKECGYNFLEISIDETDEKLSRLDMPYAQRVELLNIMAEAQLPIHTMCLSGHRKYPMGSMDNGVIQRSMDIMEKALEFAQHLGIRIIQLAGYDVYYESSSERTRERFTENLFRAVSLATKYGVMMGFETMETEFMNTVSKAMHFVKLINSPYLGVYPDVGNITNAAKLYSSDVLEDLRSGSGSLVAVHLKESLPGIFREVPFGQGHVDFRAVIETTWGMGVRRYVTELWRTDDSWRASIEHASAMMRGILDSQI